MIKVKAPGKLFIAGEYAVTELAYPAILVAVDRFISIEIEKALDKGTISAYNDRPYFWSRKNNKIILEDNDKDFRYIKAAMELVEEYARDLGKNPSNYHIRVVSQLEEVDGSKYGLGSSSAVTVGLVEGLCKYYDLQVNKEKIFKLAALANLRVNPKGSCGDIAASSYGGWISFSSFDNEKILEASRKYSMTEIIDCSWPGLKISRLKPPKDLKLMVGWTGSPASTVSLVQQVKLKKNSKRESYENFLSRSKTCVEEIIKGFKEKDIAKIKREINKNGHLLERLGEDFQVDIVTDKLRDLCLLAQKYGGGAKTSGAGGGDCGIAIFQDREDLDQLVEKWESAGIRFLDMEVYYK